MTPAPARLAVALTAVQCAAGVAWTVYAALLPALLASAGIAPTARPWILLADALAFGACDLLAGAWLDGADRALRRFGGVVLAALSLATLAFLALPRVARGPAAAPLLLATLALWVVTSAALRAPLPRLLARRASLPDRPRLGAFLAVGSGLAAALSPSALDLLQGYGATAAFALSGVTLWALAVVMLALDRAAAPPAPPPVTTVAATPTDRGRIVGATALAALAAQLVTAAAAPALLRPFVGAAAAGEGAAVFGVGMALAVVPAGWVRSYGALRSSRAACAVGALAVAGAWWAPSPAALVAALGLAGGAWGVALTASLAAVTARAPGGRASRWTGLWFAAQAAATGARVALGMAGGASTAAACAAAAGLWVMAALTWPRERAG